MKTLSVSIDENLWCEIDRLHKRATEEIVKISPDSSISKSRMVARWIVKGIELELAVGGDELAARG